MFKERLWHNGVLAILRGFKEDEAIDAAHALLEAGITALEVTSDSPGAWRIIETLKKKDPRLVVGAGTVLDTETAHQAIEVGADFLFSPLFIPEMMQIAHRYGRIAIPGAMTPTEVMRSLEAGADIVKLFPAGSLGVNYLKELRGPFPYIPFLPTGGITLENAPDFIQAGAVGVGMGSSLVKRDWVKEKKFAQITRQAQDLQERIQKVV
ncbi:bifunctional 4-hydroxy-2-oxoglutarate aldolase/2-dehydro-3-deoxy-phosphogluconate aldolase [Desulfitobacterium sp.]|uniref:bifunctional 4-hydroxy-2-oxoglutarate aldolase/2-dehydro-3-deoxy-phosphogluconate aldolase n=1 Tax=Desulfitobacterium sp. TaxID=49981 RepID=UPI002BF243A4|nr:bifunctional 4-hydroxy-2-oxoglutarate aldolase/2-dehydro-3-deoxy-phosphogluconate aldolase [Desulfitobacterium sp.]HVJ47881.1 bifunctional 4-hydroxy-2-oxoglutarate aldolase/2-dehydro-3-deoxy-phosphogluconate aldolase [Desulfitobacterium sp.]